ncbi:MAG: hypothetical protein JXM72_07265, partial [Deltaproteobacteria bacterium]|nr:hypothetical protein [Deltaproteobacteria bacterium]
KAFKKGLVELDRYRRNLMAIGKTLIERIPENSKVIVLLGRSYNLYHKVLNLGIPELIESLGYTVIPMDIIPDTACNTDVVERFPDMYWHLGQKILRKALSLAGRPEMFPLLISNFSCGPDSFILSYFEEICRHKPYLILELDEHGSATGYQTRIEAFCDMIEQYAGQKTQPKHRPSSRIQYRLDDIKGDARIWIPQIHPYIPQLWASVLQHRGFHAIAMGEETSFQCNAGRAYCRGSECLPAALTIGKFLSCTDSAPPGSSDVLFMPRAEGPCRFGQYATLQSEILDRAGKDNAYIFSPTSENGYAFLNKKTECEVWKATCLGDMLYKLRCRTMPYHPQPEMCEIIFKRTLREISTKMLMGEDFSDTIRLLVHELNCCIDYNQPRKPLVGIVGEIFVRLNSFSNQHVVETIESCGAEAWLSPFTEWVHYVLALVSKKAALKTRLGLFVKRRYIQKLEQDISKLFSPVLDNMHEPHVSQLIEKGQRFVPVDFEGEAILTLGRAKLFADQGAALVVNCSPFGCMPGRITSYIFQNNPEYFEVPVVNLFFDGIGDIASQVAIYLKSITLTRAEMQHQFFSSFKKRSGKRYPSVISDNTGVQNDHPS